MNHWAHLVGEIPIPRTAPTRRVRKFSKPRVKVPRSVRIAQRRDSLLTFLRQHSHATATELSIATRWSINTIKSDIAALQQAGHPIRSSGGQCGGYRWMAA